MLPKIKEILALSLIFSLLTLSVNLYAEKKGANLLVQKKDVKEVRGELIIDHNDFFLKKQNDQYYQNGQLFFSINGIPYCSFTASRPSVNHYIDNRDGSTLGNWRNREGKEVNNRKIISQGGGTLGSGHSGLDISLGVYRWIKLEYSYGISNFLDLGIWCDFQPILIGWSTIGIFFKLGHRYSWGELGFRAGAGYAFGVLGDNTAGHGIESSGEGSQGYLYELEAMNGLFLSNKLAFISQGGLLITNQRNTDRAKWGFDVNKLTYIPYLGIGLEKIGKKVNFFIIARITYVNRIKSDNDFIFPDAKLGVLWHF